MLLLAEESPSVACSGCNRHPVFYHARIVGLDNVLFRYRTEVRPKTGSAYEISSKKSVT